MPASYQAAVIVNPGLSSVLAETRAANAPMIAHYLSAAVFATLVGMMLHQYKDLIPIYSGTSTAIAINIRNQQVATLIDEARGTAALYGTIYVATAAEQQRIRQLAIENSSAAAAGGTTAYDTAKEGGKNSGLLKNYKDRNTSELQKGIDSMRKQIIKHEDKIANPTDHVPNFSGLSAQEQQGLLNKWAKDIARAQEQIEVLEGILKSLGG